MDSHTVKKLEYIVSGYLLSNEDKELILDLMEVYATSEIKRKVPNGNKILENAIRHSLDKKVTPVNFIENFEKGAKWLIEELENTKNEIRP